MRRVSRKHQLLKAQELTAKNERSRYVRNRDENSAADNQQKELSTDELELSNMASEKSQPPTFL